jgi:hypothetical protein
MLLIGFNSTTALSAYFRSWVFPVSLKPPHRAKFLTRMAPPCGHPASKELAQNGVRRETVPDMFGGARRTLCASCRSRLGFWLSCALRFQHAAANVPSGNGSRISRAVRIRGR